MKTIANGPSFVLMELHERKLLHASGENLLELIAQLIEAELVSPHYVKKLAEAFIISNSEKELT